MPRQASAWTNTFGGFIKCHDLDGATAYLEEMRTGHANTPPQAVKDEAIQLIQQAYAADADRLFVTGMALVTSQSAGAREIGISLLPPFYESAGTEINEQFIRVGDDANWEVREWAASALAHVVDGHFDLVYPHLRQWATHMSANVRRMMVVATGYAMRDCSVTQCEQLLGLLAPLMTDMNGYVSKNLGPFALGSYALRYHPSLVVKWATTLNLLDEQTAWNLAMMLTSAQAPKHIQAFQGLLVPLVHDDRKRVQRAVRKAMIHLHSRNPLAVAEVLRAWESSPDTSAVALRVNTAYLPH